MISKLAATVSFGLLGGCVSLEYYPVCVVPSNPAMSHTEFIEHVRMVQKKLAFITNRVRPSAHLSSYGLYLRTHKAAHRSVRLYWPNLACARIRESSATTDQLFRSCQADIERYLRASGGTWPGPEAQGYMTCDHPGLPAAVGSARASSGSGDRLQPDRGHASSVLRNANLAREPASLAILTAGRKVTLGNPAAELGGIR